MKKFLLGVLKWIGGKVGTVFSHISGREIEKVKQEVEREKRTDERTDKKESLRREQIEKWRDMVWELRQKNNSERSETLGTELKDLLEGHKDYESLSPHLSEETKSYIDSRDSYRIHYVKDNALTLIAEDIIKLETKWGLI